LFIQSCRSGKRSQFTAWKFWAINQKHDDWQQRNCEEDFLENIVNGREKTTERKGQKAESKKKGVGDEPLVQFFGQSHETGESKNHARDQGEAGLTLTKSALKERGETAQNTD